MNRLRMLMMRKVRGIRVIDLTAAACLVLIVMGVYWSKTGAGAESAKIADTTRQIAAEEQSVRLLRAQYAVLTRPERLRRLSDQLLHMQPVPATHEATPETLLTVPAKPVGAPVVIPAATPPERVR